MSDKHFDIEHFPTSPTALRMMSRISPIYDRAYVGKWIFQVMGLDMDEVRLRFGELSEQAFPETATWGLAYWELRYGIEGAEGKDIELRRQEVLSHRGARAPLNPKKVEAILSALTGREVIVTEDVAPYTFSVEVMDGDSAFDYAAVIRRIKRLKPSHQAFTFTLTFPSPMIRTAAFTEARLTVEVWPDIVKAVELAPARVNVGAALGQRVGVGVWPGTVEAAEATATVKVGAPAHQGVSASVWPATVEKAEATAKAGIMAGMQQAAIVQAWPGTAESAEATAKANTAAGMQQDTVTRIWPGAVERVETKAGAAGATVEIHQTIEIWP